MSVDGSELSRIGPGLLVLLGVAKGDAEGTERIQRALKAILGATEAISANANARLVLENLFFEVAGTLRPTL